jgi:hypothetical protein
LAWQFYHTESLQLLKHPLTEAMLWGSDKTNILYYCMLQNDPILSTHFILCRFDIFLVSE